MFLADHYHIQRSEDCPKVQTTAPKINCHLLFDQYSYQTTLKVVLCVGAKMEKELVESLSFGSSLLIKDYGLGACTIRSTFLC